MDTDKQQLVMQTNVREYFRDAVATAMHSQKINADENTAYYLVNLLTDFARSEAFFDTSHGNTSGVALQPLAAMYANAVSAPSVSQQRQKLRRLGDVALFISGVFSDSLNRKVVDIDYYIAMGRNAYSHLACTDQGNRQRVVLGEVFQELSEHFLQFVDVLGEVSEQAHLTNANDVMRLYEVWVRTRSKRAERRLRGLGIEPASGANTMKH